jgi:hypothetical protein
MTFLTNCCEVQETQLSCGSTRKAIKKELKFFLYEVSAVQQLKNADYHNGLNYCKWFTNVISQNGANI